MVGKSAPAKTSKRSSSALSLVVVAAVWVALLWGSSVEAARTSNKNLGTSVFDRYLKSTKSDKSSSEEEIVLESKSTKSLKSCKSGGCNYEDDDIVGNSTDYEDEEEEEEEYATKSYKSKGSKGSKSGYSVKSEKSEKSEKGSKSKSDKSDKSGKSKSGKSEKCSKSGKSSKSCDGEEEEEEESGFTPSVSWNTTFPDAVDTGFLFYDEVTMYAWYAYTAENTTAVSVDTNGTVTAVKATAIEGDSVTIGKICPLDVADSGKLQSDLCIEITGTNGTSTEIIAAETCVSTVNDSILKMAVVLEDSEGSSLIVYDIVVAGKAGGDAVDVKVFYEGWKSLYSATEINGQPAFTPDCKEVFATYATSDTSITVATDVEASSELWRLGTSSLLAGFTSTKDGKSIISATYVPGEDTIVAGGVVKLSAATGQIEEEFAWPANTLRLPHNAFTNPVLDDKGNTYHIDSLLGLVKFEGDDLNDGPIWSAVGGTYREVDYIPEEEVEEEVALEILEVPENEIDVRRKLADLERPRSARSKIIVDGDDDVAFTAFQPALDESDFATVYGCGMTKRGEESDGVIALASNDGDGVWHTKFDDYNAVNVGSCRGITDDIVWGPSTESSTGYAVYVARHDVILALDAKNGTALWKFQMEGDGATKFVVISDEAMIAANVGLVAGLETIAPVIANGTRLPTMEPTSRKEPTLMPSRAPLAPPTPMPVATTINASASTRGFSYVAAAMAALPLLFMLR